MKTIAFIRRGASLRDYNMAYALKKSGQYKTILILQGMDDETRKLFSQAFDEIITINPLKFRYRKKGSLWRYLINQKFKHYVYNKVGYLCEKFKLPKILDRDIDVYNCLIKPYSLSNMVMKKLNRTVVFDAYDFDGVIKGIENLPSLTYKWERFDFGVCDGIIHRGGKPEMDYLHEHGYFTTCSDLQWLDYTNKDFFVHKKDMKKLSDEDGEWHLVHIGSAIVPEFIPYAKTICSQGLHLHIYPTSISPVTYFRLKKLDKENKYFHMHDTLSFEDINLEIAKYDFGCHFYFNEMHLMGLQVAHCHRFFNYLEAGLPMIVTKHKDGGIMNSVVDNKVGFALNNRALKCLYMFNAVNLDELKKNVLKARKKYLIDKQAKRLIKFYDKLVN